jgi:hypothetical protein
VSSPRIRYSRTSWHGWNPARKTSPPQAFFAAFLASRPSGAGGAIAAYTSKPQTQNWPATPSSISAQNVDRTSSPVLILLFGSV